MEEKSKVFTYTYSAAQQEEVKRIRDKYAPPTREEDKLERLRRLDQSVTRPGLIAALIVGIIGICVAYPLYVHITNKRREKLAPEIMRIADELIK